MKQEEATAYTEKCFNGEPASCSFACPYRLDIRSFLEKTEKGRWNAAYKTLRGAVVFPVIACALCPAPCEDSCQRPAVGDEPIAMSLIEQACIRYAKSRKPDSYVIPPKDKKIAVVGSGLAGLSGALGLAQKKFKVTVFEKNPGWGGVLRGDPRFDVFSEDIELQFSAVETEFMFNTEIKSPEELSDYDAVYIATGSDGADFGLKDGWDADLLSTENPRIFLGGALTGADTAGCITQGLLLSKTVEVFLQTGKAAATYGDNRKDCSRQVDHTGTPSVARIEPSEESGYTEQEARAESARCMKCDCTRCMDSCEMLSSFRKKPKKIATEVFTDTQVNPPYSSHTLTREAYSCNMCGHCKNVCPEDCDIGAVLQLSRAARAQESVYPAALHDYWLREMEFSSSDASFYVMPEGVRNCEYVFFPGCQLGAARPEYVLESYEILLKNYNAGIFAACCGAPAYWAGETSRQEQNFENIRAVSRALGNPKFVFACATCESIFAKFLPEIERVSLYELLMETGDIKPVASYDSACVFDPCNARKNPEMEAAVRTLAQKSGVTLCELPEKNRCCGWGGHMRLGNPELYNKITENRAVQSDNPYIVYCANCREVFLQRGKSCVHILDMALNLPSAERAPRIAEKRENAIRVKKEILQKMKNETFSPPKNEWDDIELIVSEPVAEDIDSRLISLGEVKEAIWRAETGGDYFTDDNSEVFRCSMEKPVLTYWVTYKKTDGGFEVLEAYCHRMSFSREDA